MKEKGTMFTLPYPTTQLHRPNARRLKAVEEKAERTLQHYRKTKHGNIHAKDRYF